MSAVIPTEGLGGSSATGVGTSVVVEAASIDGGGDAGTGEDGDDGGAEEGLGEHEPEVLGQVGDDLGGGLGGEAQMQSQSKGSLSKVIPASDLDESGEMQSKGALSNVIPASGSDEPDQQRHRENMRRAFRLFDQDGSGRISIAELHSILHWLGEEITYEECRELQQMVESPDDGEDNTLNFDEFCALMSHNNHGPGGAKDGPSESPSTQESTTFFVTVAEKRDTVAEEGHCCRLICQRKGPVEDPKTLVWADQGEPVTRLHIREGDAVVLNFGRCGTCSLHQCESNNTVIENGFSSSSTEGEGVVEDGIMHHTFEKTGTFYACIKQEETGGTNTILRLQIVVTKDFWVFVKQMGNLIVSVLLVVALVMGAIAFTKQWLLDEDNDLLMPPPGSLYGDSIEVLRDIFVRNFLPPFAAGVVVLLLLPLIRLGVCCYRPSVNGFGAGFKTTLITGFLTAVFCTVFAIIILTIALWGLHVHFSEGLHVIAGESVVMAQDIVNKLLLVVTNMHDLAVWYHTNVEPSADMLDQADGLVTAVNITKQYTDQGQGMLSALNRAQLVFMFLLLQVVLVNCALGIAGVMGRRGDLLRRMMWCSLISLAFFCFYLAVELPLWEVFGALHDQTSTEPSGDGTDANNPMIALVANCQGDDSYMPYLRDMLQQASEMASLMGAGVPGVVSNMVSGVIQH
jgi:Ca2+-binding EF-hand superfamily protein